MILGFTGTQRGMTAAQKAEFLRLVAKLAPREFHHGDCIGADADAHQLVRQHDFRIRIVIHPPTNSAKRAYYAGDFVENYLPYLQRNHKIVDASQVILATPGEKNEVLRSGTWATIRYALKRKKPTYIIFPDGSYELN